MPVMRAKAKKKSMMKEMGAWPSQRLSATVSGL
jgi:hypothetical protein